MSKKRIYPKHNCRTCIFHRFRAGRQDFCDHENITINPAWIQMCGTCHHYEDRQMSLLKEEEL